MIHDSAIMASFEDENLKKFKKMMVKAYLKVLEKSQHC